VNHNQRRDLSAERRAEILEAFKRCIITHGLDGSSMRLVAAEAGISQPLIAHHFGSRAGFVEALVRYVVDQADQDLALALEKLSQEGGAEVLLQYLYGGAYSKVSERDDGLFLEFVTAATRDEGIREQVGKAYARYQGILASHLRKTYPKATAAEIRRVSYALMCLAEMNEHLRALELPGRSARDALEAGRALLASLPE
jgi:AcrR family transcriptional regulator